MTYSEWSIVSLSPWPQEYIVLIWLLLGLASSWSPAAIGEVQRGGY